MISYRIARPLFRSVDAETAHELAVRALSLGLAGDWREDEDPILASRVWDLPFPNPLGLAAGFDKDARVLDAALALGFGFVEAGTVTPRPQSGNPRPRLFRLDEDDAVINRYGFNSSGLPAFAERFARRRNRPRIAGICGANVGKNRDTADAVQDYVACVDRLARLADYLVVNVSSPNTPGLRSLQARAQIEDLLQHVMQARQRSLAPGLRPPPLLAKVGPDLDEQQLQDVAEAALRVGVDGLIVGNTTVDRPSDLRSRYRGETGGLSGRPLTAKALECLARMYRATHGRVPLIGCGGIASGAEAYARIRAGACLIQLYTALVFKGPQLVNDIKRELASLLRADGFSSVSDAVGTQAGESRGVS
jgi:dihydroorotate dehydrogenase